ncbi:MAG: flagellin [Bryobacteraceae bacterium]
MIRGPDSQSEQFLNDLAQISSRLDRAQRQVATGKRINTLSDAPDQVGHLLSLRSELASVQQIQTNIGRVKAEVGTAESALSQAVDVLERIQSLTVQGGSDFATPQARETLAGEVEVLLGQLVSIAQSQIEGRYIFSGDADQDPPYTVDLTLDDPASDYAGTPATRQIQHPNGTRFALARTAEQIFDNQDAPGANVFDAANAARLALRSNDVDAIGAALSALKSANTHLNDQLAWYGGVQAQVNAASDFASRQAVQVQTRIAEVEDADITQAIVELQQASFQRDAALSAQAARPRKTLFDYLG